jgi:hypothetical protein
MAWMPEAAIHNGMASQAHAPIENIPDHDKSQCLNVIQVDNWRIFPPSRVLFRVLFESGKTGERASRRFELVRTMKGAWRYQMMNEPF